MYCEPSIPRNTGKMIWQDGIILYEKKSLNVAEWKEKKPNAKKKVLFGALGDAAVIHF